MKVPKASIFLLLSSSVLLSMGIVKADNDLNVTIQIDLSYDQHDPNEWGPGWGGEEIQAEWGEPVNLKALPLTSINRSVIYIWNITNMNDGNSVIYQGNEIEVVFYPSDRRLDIIQAEKFSINLTVWYVRSKEYGTRIMTHLWIWSDDDNDNDGLPDSRERYYWDGDIIHHHPDYDEDGDGFTNIQEIGFNIPLADSEKTYPYHPALSFDPTDPHRPRPEINITGPKRTKGPNGPVMPNWAMYTLVGGIGSIGILTIIGDIIYYKFYYLASSRKVKEQLLLEKSGKDRPLPLLEVLQNRSVG